MLACARIGAIHSVVFGGFAPEELGRRIQHAEVPLYHVLMTENLNVQHLRSIKYFHLFYSVIEEQKIIGNNCKNKK